MIGIAEIKASEPRSAARATYNTNAGRRVFITGVPLEISEWQIAPGLGAASAKRMLKRLDNIIVPTMAVMPCYCEAA